MNPTARLIALEARTDAILFSGGYVNTPDGVLREKGVGAHVNRHAGAYVGTVVAPGLGTLIGASVDGSRRNRNIARAKDEATSTVAVGRTPEEARKLANRRLAVGAGVVGLYAGLRTPWGRQAVGSLSATMKARRQMRSPSGGPHFSGRIVDIEGRKLAARVDAILFGNDEEPTPFWKRAAGALGTAALVGATAYGANRFVRGRYGNQGLDSWKAAGDEAKLRFRSAWGAPKAAITPPVVGAPAVGALPPGGIGPLAAGVKPAVGGVASTRQALGFKQVAAGALAKDARDAGRRQLQNVLAGPLLPKQRFTAIAQCLVDLEARADEILFVDPRVRDPQGQFAGAPGADATQDPAAMRAAYRPRPPDGFARMIAANHRQRLLRLAKTLGVGATAGVVGTLGTQAVVKGLAARRSPVAA